MRADFSIYPVAQEGCQMNHPTHSTNNVNQKEIILNELRLDSKI